MKENDKKSTDLHTISLVLKRMKQLAIEANNGSPAIQVNNRGPSPFNNKYNYNYSLEEEFKELLKEIDDIASKNSFNGINLLK